MTGDITPHSHPHPDHEDIVLIGGPRDGIVVGYHGRPPMGLFIPQAPPVGLDLSQGHPRLADLPPGIQVAVYEVGIVFNHPSRDDQGRLRYIYKRTETR